MGAQHEVERPRLGEKRAVGRVELCRVDDPFLQRLPEKLDLLACCLAREPLGVECPRQLPCALDIFPPANQDRKPAPRCVQARMRAGKVACRAGLRLDLIRPETCLCEKAIDHRIAECIHMPAGLPNRRVHNDARVERNDVVALAHHRLPPRVPQIAPQLGSEWAVVPEPVEAAVDFGRLKNKPAPLAEAHDLFHALR